MNGLLLRAFWQITCYTYVYNILSYLILFIIPNGSVIGFLKRYLQNQTRPQYTGGSIAKKSPKQKIYRAKESPFCAKQNGKSVFM